MKKIFKISLIVIGSIILVFIGLKIYNHINTPECIVEFHGETVQFASKDKVQITADVYKVNNTSTPWIILYHQGSYSRGEYHPIASELNTLGFNCIAIDQRSGNTINGIDNQTRIEASKLDKGTRYYHAYPDMEAGLQYVKDNFNPKTLLVWGSSYSASLVLILGKEYQTEIDGIIAFSPPALEYKEIQINEYAKSVKLPTFIAASSSEYEDAKTIYDLIQTSNKKIYAPETGGLHGSKSLWNCSEGNQDYWKELQSFLSQFKKP
ncbi:pimeloyl-ACP methyl ester carboxylesterase [Aquimarina sp. EL_43]|uniref:alpha/beta hydrolase n=1 Tax=unclassified Aquimarina TaxID=2627091 RepID=UPI0018CB1684|nr:MULTISPECIES: hypothetical protein [unclassified Aquimarina]MBG6132512.1 pimeloyl-ACP methyl ester carboxylesterase [Aquimarina sp. EL_35]MBG6152643.1 pimeloyl-ACP methyl ester carboxylesterase [Aquimarina sp. EL_32]MBG6170650.1 pimeloyl-ACP methyl ester carboxylesterase [Aquimarina sp. EL_43]